MSNPLTFTIRSKFTGHSLAVDIVAIHDTVKSIPDNRPDIFAHPISRSTEAISDFVDTFTETPTNVTAGGIPIGINFLRSDNAITDTTDPLFKRFTNLLRKALFHLGEDTILTVEEEFFHRLADILSKPIFRIQPVCLDRFFQSPHQARNFFRTIQHVLGIFTIDELKHESINRTQTAVHKLERLFRDETLYPLEGIRCIPNTQAAAEFTTVITDQPTSRLNSRIVRLIRPGSVNYEFLLRFDDIFDRRFRVNHKISRIATTVCNLLGTLIPARSLILFGANSVISFNIAQTGQSIANSIRVLLSFPIHRLDVLRKTRTGTICPSTHNIGVGNDTPLKSIQDISGEDISSPNSTITDDTSFILFQNLLFILRAKTITLLNSLAFESTLCIFIHHPREGNGNTVLSESIIDRSIRSITTGTSRGDLCCHGHDLVTRHRLQNCLNRIRIELFTICIGHLFQKLCTVFRRSNEVIMLSLALEPPIKIILEIVIDLGITETNAFTPTTELICSGSHSPSQVIRTMGLTRDDCRNLL